MILLRVVPRIVLKSFQAAIDGNYGIELDLQISSDGVAMVFHDYGLARLTAAKGPVAQHTAAQLGDISLLHDGGRYSDLGRGFGLG